MARKPSSAVFRALAPKIMRGLMNEFALDLESAAAILGNLGHESGGFRFLQEKKPLVPGSRGGWGWAQWTGPRRRAFEAWVRAQKLDPAGYEANYGYLVLELHGAEKAAVPAVKRAKGLAAKVKAFELGFERASKNHKHYASRERWAAIALEAFSAALKAEAAEPAPVERSETVIRQAQHALKAKGYYHSNVDGLLGPLTLAAISQFQKRNSIQVTGQLDDGTLALLADPAALDNAMPPERANATEKQVVGRFGMVLALVRTRLIALLASIGTALAGLIDFATSQFEAVQEWYGKLQPYLPRPWMLAIVMAAVLAYLYWRSRQGVAEATEKFNKGALQ